MKMKRVLCALLASTMVLGFAGCGNNDSGSKASSAAPSSKTESTPASTPESSEASTSGEPQTLKLSVIETAYGATAWDEVIAAFEADHAGVTVEITIDKNLEDVIGPSMKSGDYPDVIHLSVGREKGLTETFIKDENIADLSDVMEMTVPGEDKKVKDKILPGFLDTTVTNPYSDGKTYLAPMFYAPCGLFYNAGLFKEKGWEVPKTWDEMWALGDKAKAEGISLFTYPHAGYFDAFFYGMLYTAGGDELFNKATHYEEGIWDTPEAKQVFDTIAKLATYTEPTTPANGNDQNFQKNQQLILDNKALFMPNGTWVTGEMAEAPRAEGFEWGFAPLPALKDGVDRYSYTFFEQLWIPKSAEHVDLAKEFIAYMYSDKAADIFAKAGAVQPLEGMDAKLEGENKMFYSIYNDGVLPALGTFATTDPVEGVTVRSTFFDPVDSLVTGDKTEDDYIAQVKKDSDLLRAALK